MARGRRSGGCGGRGGPMVIEQGVASHFGVVSQVVAADLVVTADGGVSASNSVSGDPG